MRKRRAVKRDVLPDSLYKSKYQIITTPKRRGFHMAYKALISTSPQMKASFHFVQGPCNDYFSIPLKGFSYSFFVNLSSILSSFSCSLIYFLIVASFSPTVLT